MEDTHFFGEVREPFPLMPYMLQGFLSQIFLQNSSDRIPDLYLKYSFRIPPEQQWYLGTTLITLLTVVRRSPVCFRTNILPVLQTI